MGINTTFLFLLLLFSVLPLLSAAPVIECAPPFTAVGGKCISVYTPAKGTWYAMKNFCEDLGGQLLIINTDNFYYYLVQYIENNGYSGNNYWIGANNEYVDDVYHWLDGTKVKMGTPFWGVHNGIQEPAIPTEHCAGIFSFDYYYMHDYRCDEELYPICEAT